MAPDLRLWGICDTCQLEFRVTFESFAELARRAEATSWLPICDNCRNRDASAQMEAQA